MLRWFTAVLLWAVREFSVSVGATWAVGVIFSRLCPVVTYYHCFCVVHTSHLARYCQVNSEFYEAVGVGSGARLGL